MGFTEEGAAGGFETILLVDDEVGATFLARSLSLPRRDC